MNNNQAVMDMTDIMSKFVALVGKKLPDDVTKKLKELSDIEEVPMAKMIYESMFLNQKMALEFNRPSCQDTGVIQFFARVGTKFPLIDDLESILRNAVVEATKVAPLRHNAVETFDEKNTGTNTGTKAPWIDYEIVPHSDKVEIDVYMAGGGCSLPGTAKVLMPSAGYEEIVRYVCEVMTTYGLNACPPLLVGIGVGTSVETAAIMSKKALMRRIGTHNTNEKAAELERMLEEGINKIGLGPQGLTGTTSVMGVHIENSARHPSTIGVAVNVGCWSHRRGTIVMNSDLSYELLTHEGVEL